MKKLIFILTLLMFIICGLQAQHLKKDGSPDMRYKENKQTYSTPSSGTNSDVRYQNGYQKSNGTYVEPHNKTNSNNTNLDNFSTKDNTNPYNGKEGSKAKDNSDEAQNYGAGKTIYTGEKGGQYYINDNGNKVYVPKR